MKKEIAQIFDDLDCLLDYCRINLLPYNPADLYNRNSKVFRDFEYSKKPHRPWNREKKTYPPRQNNERFSR